MFAATNGHSIQLYRTYTAEPIALLRGHNNKVQSYTGPTHAGVSGKDAQCTRGTSLKAVLPGLRQRRVLGQARRLQARG